MDEQTKLKCFASYRADVLSDVVHCSFPDGHDRIVRPGIVGRGSWIADHGNEHRDLYWRSEKHDSGFGEFADPALSGAVVADEPGTLPDMVNHPPHYQRGGLEVIDVLQAFFPADPLLWQVGKYVMRAGHKEDFVQDLEKARWYLDRRIEELKNA